MKIKNNNLTRWRLTSRSRLNVWQTGIYDYPVWNYTPVWFTSLDGTSKRKRCWIYGIWATYTDYALYADGMLALADSDGWQFGTLERYNGTTGPANLEFVSPRIDYEGGSTLLGTTELSNTDGSIVKALTNGDINQWMYELRTEAPLTAYECEQKLLELETELKQIESLSY